MPVDPDLHAARNRTLRADYNRLKAEERPFRLHGRTVYVRLTASQIVQVLSTLYHLSPRRVEYLVYATEPHPAPLGGT